MTRLELYRAVLATPAADNLRRASRPIYEKADAEKLRITNVTITTKRKPRKKAAKSSRIGWLKGVHERRGA